MAAAHDLILAEGDGKCRCVVDTEKGLIDQRVHILCILKLVVWFKLVNWRTKKAESDEARLC